jgi:hypothetical protein
MTRKSLIGAAISAAAGAALFGGVAFAATSSLLVELDVSPNVAPGTHSTVALIKLDASNSVANIKIPSLSLTGSFSGGAGQNTFRNCSVALANAIKTPLNTNGNAVSSFGNSTAFTFDTPLTVPAGTTLWLGLVCDVDAAAPQAGMVTLGINPSMISATNASSTEVIVPTASVNTSGAQLTSGTANTYVAPAPISGSTSGSGSAATPGIPNTGAGGDSDSTILLLIVSALAVASSLLLFVKNSKASA